MVGCWLRKIVTSSDWRQPVCTTPGSPTLLRIAPSGQLVRGLMLIHEVLSTDEMKDHVEHL